MWPDSLTDSLSEWPGHLLSCPGQLKKLWESYLPVDVSIGGYDVHKVTPVTLDCLPSQVLSDNTPVSAGASCSTKYECICTCVFVFVLDVSTEQAFWILHLTPLEASTHFRVFSETKPSRFIWLWKKRVKLVKMLIKEFRITLPMTVDEYQVNILQGDEIEAQA